MRCRLRGRNAVLRFGGYCLRSKILIFDFLDVILLSGGSDMTLRVVLEYDDVVNSWAAYCPELPGINSYGATQEEASANFKEAAELFFEPSDFLIPKKSKVLQMVV